MNAADSYTARVLAQLRAFPAPPASPPSRLPDRVEPVNPVDLAAGIGQLADPAAHKARMRAAMKNSNPDMSRAEDWGRSAVTSLEQGLTGSAGLLTGAAPMREQAASAGAKIGAWLTGQPTEPAAASASAQARAADQAMAQVGQHLGPGGLALAGAGPTQGDYDQHVQDIAGPYHQPQSLGGRIIQTIGQNALGAAMPGGLGARAMRVLLPSLTGQAAYEVAPAKYKDAAKIAGTLFGGGAEGWGEAQFKPPYQAVGATIPGVSDEQLALAQGLKDRAAKMGVQLTNAEALQQATGGATDIGRLQRLAESTRVTAPRMKAFFADRPAQVDSAVRGFTTPIAPDMPAPGVVGLGAQRSGQGALDFVRKSINEAATPYYDALKGEHLPPELHAQLTQSPAYRQGLADLRSDPILNDPVKDLPDHNLAVVNEVVKRLDRNANASAITQMNPSGDNQLAAAYDSARGQADDMAGGVSDNWSKARGTVAQGRQTFLDPLEAGPVGRIAATTDVGPQTAALYPQSPPVGAPAETAQAIHVLNSQDPSVARNLTRQHMEGAWNEANRNLIGGANQFAGAKYMKGIEGNSEQGANLRSAFDAIDPSGGLGSKYDDLAQALWATGQRERPGSLTSFNSEDIGKFKQPGAVMRFIGAAGDPLEWTKNLANWSGGAIGNKRLQGLADILLDNNLRAVLGRARDATPFTPFLPASPAVVQSQGSTQ